MIRRILRFIDRLPRPLIDAVAVMAVLAIGYLDSLTAELDFSLFYVMPIAVATWYGTRMGGALLSALATLAWLLGDLLNETGRAALAPNVVWNVPAAFLFFLIVVQLVTELRDTQRRLEDQALRDPLTGLFNRRAFLETAGVELARARRSGHPLTLTYLDLDGFKKVNDTLGHEIGDRVLKETAAALRENVRVTDTAARLGGDEFALLFPETGRDQARVVVAKLRERLLQSMGNNRWPVTASIGSVTCPVPPPSVDALIAAADDLMYGVKKAGKNGIADDVMG
jgi:diguanylate cyclase (GGDEF)-like protein